MKKGIPALVGILWIWVLVIVGSSACSSVDSQPTEPLNTSVASATALTLPTETPEPSPTPQPGLVILLTPPGSDADLAQTLQEPVAELAGEAGLEFEVRSQLSDADWNADVRLVIVLPPDPGLDTLAPAHPDVRFLALGIPGLEPGANLSVVGLQGERLDSQGFIAGYLAAVITPDWRVGVISRADTSDGKAAQGGFINGTVFYCGLCRPAYPPFFQYPVSANVTAGASLEEQQAAADLLISNAVQTVYIAPESADQSTLEYLAEADVSIIGSHSPPAQLQDNWVATLRVDWSAAVKEAWEPVLNGDGGLILAAPIQLSDRNEALFSLGRQGYVERMMADLFAGYIDTGVDPFTGESR